MTDVAQFRADGKLLNEMAGLGPVHRPVEKIVILRWQLLRLGDADSKEIAEALLWAMELASPGTD